MQSLSSTTSKRNKSKFNNSFVMHFKPGQASYVRDGVKSFIQVGDYTREWEKSQIREMLHEHYNQNIEEMKSKVSSTFVVIYGENLVIKSKFISEVLIKLKYIMEQTGKTIDQIIKEIRQFLGYECSFFRIDEKGRRIPVDSKRIATAFNLVKERKSLIAVEDALYF